MTQSNDLKEQVAQLTHPNAEVLGDGYRLTELVKAAREQSDRIEALEAALRPFADFADPHGSVPASLAITQGSPMAKRQLTMADCYAASQALKGNP